jgi:predicted ATPase
MVQKFGLVIRETDDDGYQKNGALCSREENYVKHRALEEHCYWLSVFKKRQLEVYNVFEAYLQDLVSTEVKKLPSITWLNGGAGCGKSKLLKRIIFSCELKGHKCIQTAFNHINAIHVDGVTTCSLLHFNETDMDKYANFIRSSWWKEFCDVMGNAVLIVIDEFSNQAPWHLAKFLKACHVLTNKYGVPFGGTCQSWKEFSIGYH